MRREGEELVHVAEDDSVEIDVDDLCKLCIVPYQQFGKLVLKKEEIRDEKRKRRTGKKKDRKNIKRKKEKR